MFIALLGFLSWRTLRFIAFQECSHGALATFGWSKRRQRALSADFEQCQTWQPQTNERASGEDGPCATHPARDNRGPQIVCVCHFGQQVITTDNAVSLYLEHPRSESGPSGHPLKRNKHADSSWQRLQNHNKQPPRARRPLCAKAPSRSGTTEPHSPSNPKPSRSPRSLRTRLKPQAPS